ncbi:uncharacterized protein BDR25DRAFT_356295 [Lindgomyces ingoldianus]|uniref:Uncharacterized protein n=1 Tax=Lindgomyces ingoldianus TaxID=673940 RepID=A0ACB6QRD2_9PLEO|nr:uncharacterized protein BDR25DRAFT_356295 [Lindgomyces ingoldianus]KAF2469563.1 hypothetical protein BDR25DRAFT_356295 [Lindgomyces ingoldianus]
MRLRIRTRKPDRARQNIRIFERNGMYTPCPSPKLSHTLELKKMPSSRMPHFMPSRELRPQESYLSFALQPPLPLEPAGRLSDSNLPAPPILNPIALCRKHPYRSALASRFQEMKYASLLATLPTSIATFERRLYRTKCLASFDRGLNKLPFWVSSLVNAGATSEAREYPLGFPSPRRDTPYQLRSAEWVISEHDAEVKAGIGPVSIELRVSKLRAIFASGFPFCVNPVTRSTFLIEELLGSVSINSFSCLWYYTSVVVCAQQDLWATFEPSPVDIHTDNSSSTIAESHRQPSAIHSYSPLMRVPTLPSLPRLAGIPIIVPYQVVGEILAVMYGTSLPVTADSSLSSSFTKTLSVCSSNALSELAELPSHSHPPTTCGLAHSVYRSPSYAPLAINSVPHGSSAPNSFTLRHVYALYGTSTAVVLKYPVSKYPVSNILNPNSSISTGSAGGDLLSVCRPEGTTFVGTLLQGQDTELTIFCILGQLGTSPGLPVIFADQAKYSDRATPLLRSILTVPLGRSMAFSAIIALSYFSYPGVNFPALPSRLTTSVAEYYTNTVEADWDAEQMNSHCQELEMHLEPPRPQPAIYIPTATSSSEFWISISPLTSEGSTKPTSNSPFQSQESIFRPISAIYENKEFQDILAPITDQSNTNQNRRAWHKRTRLSRIPNVYNTSKDIIIISYLAERVNSIHRVSTINRNARHTRRAENGGALNDQSFQGEEAVVSSPQPFQMMPRHTANILSNISIAWKTPLMATGHRRSLEPNHLILSILHVSTRSTIYLFVLSLYQVIVPFNLRFLLSFIDDAYATSVPYQPRFYNDSKRTNLYIMGGKIFRRRDYYHMLADVAKNDPAASILQIIRASLLAIAYLVLLFINTAYSPITRVSFLGDPALTIAAKSIAHVKEKGSPSNLGFSYLPHDRSLVVDLLCHVQRLETLNTWYTQITSQNGDKAGRSAPRKKKCYLRDLDINAVAPVFSPLAVSTLFEYHNPAAHFLLAEEHQEDIQSDTEINTGVILKKPSFSAAWRKGATKTNTDAETENKMKLIPSRRFSIKDIHFSIGWNELAAQDIVPSGLSADMRQTSGQIAMGDWSTSSSAKITTRGGLTLRRTRVTWKPTSINSGPETTRKFESLMFTLNILFAGYWKRKVELFQTTSSSFSVSATGFPSWKIVRFGHLILFAVIPKYTLLAINSVPHASILEDDCQVTQRDAQAVEESSSLLLETLNAKPNPVCGKNETKDGKLMKEGNRGQGQVSWFVDKEYGQFSSHTTLAWLQWYSFPRPKRRTLSYIFGSVSGRPSASGWRGTTASPHTLFLQSYQHPLYSPLLLHDRKVSVDFPDVLYIFLYSIVLIASSALAPSNVMKQHSEAKCSLDSPNLYQGYLFIQALREAIENMNSAVNAGLQHDLTSFLAIKTVATDGQSYLFRLVNKQVCSVLKVELDLINYLLGLGLLFQV